MVRFCTVHGNCYTACSEVADLCILLAYIKNLHQEASERNSSSNASPLANQATAGIRQETRLHELLNASMGLNWLQRNV